MMPVIAWNALHATRILTNAMRVLPGALRRRASAPTRIAAASCSTAAPRSRRRSAPISATRQPPTSPRRRSQTGRSIRELVRERKLLPDEQLDAILSPEAMTSPGVPGSGAPCRSPEVAGETRRDSQHRSSPCQSLILSGAASRRRRNSTRACSARRISDSSSRRIATRGSGRTRSWTRWGSGTEASSLTSAPAADGSRFASPGASGRNGMVYAEDVQRQMIEAITRRVEKIGLQERHDGARHGQTTRASRNPSTPC